MNMLGLEFWKNTLKGCGRGLMGEEHDAEVDVMVNIIQQGALPQALIDHHGDQLLSSVLSSKSAQPDEAYELTEFSNIARFPVNSNEEWDGKGNCEPKERLIAALLSRGANPWQNFPQMNEKGVYPLYYEEGQEPPFSFAAFYNPAMRASVDAFLRHPDCPMGHQLDLFQHNYGNNLLHMALGKDPWVVDRLLRAGMDPNRLKGNGNPPLFEVNSALEAQSLLAHGADPTAINGQKTNVRSYWRQNKVGILNPLLETLPPDILDNEIMTFEELGLFLHDLYRSKPAQVKQRLSSIKNIEKMAWQKNGVRFNLLDIVVSEAVFHVCDPGVMQVVSALSAKKYRFTDEERQVVNVCASFYGVCWETEIRKWGDALKKNIGPDLGDAESGGFKRLANTANALRGAFDKVSLKSGERKDGNPVDVGHMWESTLSFFNQQFFDKTQLQSQETFNAQMDTVEACLEGLVEFSRFNRSTNTAIAMNIIKAANHLYHLNLNNGRSLSLKTWQAWAGGELLVDIKKEKKEYPVENCLSVHWAKDLSSWEDPYLKMGFETLKTRSRESLVLSAYEKLVLQESTPVEIKPSRPMRRV